MTTLDSIHSSVRPIVTYALAAALIVGFFLGKIPPDMFSSIAISVISYWFGQRERAATLPVTVATLDTTTTTHAEAQ